MKGKPSKVMTWASMAGLDLALMRCLGNKHTCLKRGLSSLLSIPLRQGGWQWGSILYLLLLSPEKWPCLFFNYSNGKTLSRRCLTILKVQKAIPQNFSLIIFSP